MQKAVPILVVFLVLNGWTAVLTCQAYTAWSIRARNLMWYAVFRQPANLRRADNAEEIAERYLPWIRMVGFTLMNALAGFVAYRILRS